MNVMKMGWLPDYPDYRDFTIEKAMKATDRSPVRIVELRSMLDDLNILKESSEKTLKSRSFSGKVDLRSYCTPIEDQGALGSCTANAGVGLMEYYENRAFHRHINASRLFLYKATWNLLGWTGDTGAFLRTTMGAMRLFGVPPEKYWPYDVANYDVEPTAFLYSYAKEYQPIRYFRLDPPGTPKDRLLRLVKIVLDAQIPSMFGFTVYQSISRAESSGKIPYPTITERVLGGHAVVAVGYDDEMKITGIDGTQTTGALIIRNSWGTSWGDQGYGYLPYKYVLTGLAIDWWSILKQEWIDTKIFGI